MTKHCMFPLLLLIFSNCVLRPRERQAVRCYKIPCVANSKEIDYVNCYLWLQPIRDGENLIANILLAENDGMVHMFMEHLRLEQKQRDGTWLTVIDFEKKEMENEVLSKSINLDIAALVESSFKNLVYPNPSSGKISDLRLNFGKRFIRK